MSSVEIGKYICSWHIREGYGRICLYDKNGGPRGIYKLKCFSPMEFTAMLDLIRNEKPIFYDQDSVVLRTSHEPIGEDEL
jgi:hypothetical protein